jgi:hypothetical protein
MFSKTPHQSRNIQQGNICGDQLHRLLSCLLFLDWNGDTYPRYGIQAGLNCSRSRAGTTGLPRVHPNAAQSMQHQFRQPSQCSTSQCSTSQATQSMQHQSSHRSSQHASSQPQSMQRSMQPQAYAQNQTLDAIPPPPLLQRAFRRQPLSNVAPVHEGPAATEPRGTATIPNANLFSQPNIAPSSPEPGQTRQSFSGDADLFGGQASEACRYHDDDGTVAAKNRG